METEPLTVSTVVLGAPRGPGPSAANDPSGRRGVERAADVPPGGPDAERAAERIDQLIRALVETCCVGDESRFEAAGLAAAASIDVADHVEESRFEAALIAPMAPADGPGPGPAADPVARLVRELVELYDRAGIPRFQDLQARHPQLPGPVLRMILDAANAHRPAGETASAEGPSDSSSREYEVIAGAGPAAELPHARSRPRPFPAVGEAVGEFRLLSCLGRGAQGAVYLADQPSLAHRPVVVKVTACDGLEHLSLAQVRHPNIVPLYCVQDLADRGLRLLCMPYLGGTPLGRLWNELSETPISRRTGRDWLAGLDRAGAGAALALPDRGPARQFLSRASYVQSVCWIGACLADALHFAHQRGLVHLDLKPPNVLLAADGTPMLLDFHLARPPIRAGEQVRLGLGGTPHYMSPEQRTAMSEIRRGQPITAAVDGRSDIYSLGLMLHQLLGGAIATGPYPIELTRPRRPPGVPVGLGDIVARCLAADPRHRYPDAAGLADDLRRQLADLPLRGVRNRSPVERWRKWRRRHPHAIARAATTLAIGPALVLAAVLIAGGDARQRLHGAASLLSDGRRHMDRRDYPAAVRDLGRGVALIDRPWVPPFDRHLAPSPDLRRELADRLAGARRHLLAEEIHRSADRLRSLFGADLADRESLRALARRLEATWDARGRILAQLAGGLDPDLDRRLRADFLDLGILLADLRVRLASGSRDVARREALRTLDEAERSFGPSPVLECERQAQAEALGLTDVARAAARSRAGMPPRTAWEHNALGRSMMAAGDIEAAARELDRATDLHPQHLWAQFARGICAYRRRRYETALGAFEVCVALAPETAECYANRGRAHAALGHAELARRDEDRARRLALATDLAAPHSPRAVNSDPIAP